MRFLSLLCFGFLFASTAFSKDFIVTSNGVDIFSYAPHELKDEIASAPKQECLTYAVKKEGERYSFAEDGIISLKEKGKILIEKTCLFGFQGLLILKDGKAMDFYLEDSMNTNGQRAFWSETRNKVPDGKYILKSGEKFQISHGAIEGIGGHVCGNSICYEDRD